MRRSGCSAAFQFAAHRFQLQPDLAHRLVALLAILSQALANDTLDACRHRDAMC